MNKQQVRDRIVEIGVVPVVRVSSAAEALLAAEAVCAGGIPIVGITMTVPGAVEVNSSRRGDGATLRGCWRRVSGQPGLNLPTVEFASREGKVILAGALTPTEVITAWNVGSDFVKIFPCGQVGGAKYIKP